MTVRTAEGLIRAISKERELGDDTLYCTSDVRSRLKQQMSAGIGSSRMLENVQIAGLNVREIPKPASGRSVAIVGTHGNVFPSPEDYE